MSTCHLFLVFFCGDPFFATFFCLTLAFQGPLVVKKKHWMAYFYLDDLFLLKMRSNFKPTFDLKK